MAGPWQRPESGIWYFRKGTPTDLLREKVRLQALGIRVTREQHRSLETRERKEAERRYAEVKLEVGAMWDSWRSALKSGPVDLNHREVVALAGHDAERVLGRAEDEPLAVPSLIRIVEVVIDNVHSHYSRRSLKDGQEVFELGQELRGLHVLQLLDRLEALAKRQLSEPQQVLLSGVVKTVEGYLDALGWVRSKRIAEDAGIALTKEARLKLADQVASYRRQVWETLQARLKGDYRQPEWVAGLPPVFTRKLASETHGLTFEAVIAKQEETSAKGLGRRLTGATLRKYRTDLGQFAKFRRSAVASTVTLAELEGWRDQLLQSHNARTVRNKLGAVKAVLEWGRGQTGGKLFDGEDALKWLALPQVVNTSDGERAYSLRQAGKLLAASRFEMRGDLRFVPWLLAYSGMRVTEATSLEQADFFQHGGAWFVHVRSGKGGTQRRVPLHDAVIEEGVVEWVQEQGSGRLFGKKASRHLTSWVDKVLDDRTGSQMPNHAWRHLFEDLCRRHRLDDRAVKYITGRREAGSVNRYGKSPAFWGELHDEINKIPRLKLLVGD